MQCNATYYLFTVHGKELDIVCNAMQCKKCMVYVSLQCATLDRLRNAMQNVISSMNIWRSKIWCAMQCNAKSPYPKCYSSMLNVRSFLQCNAIQCNATCYLFTEHGKELVSVCNAMQRVHKCYSSMHNVRSFLQCNAMQCNATCVISLMNMGRS